MPKHLQILLEMFDGLACAVIACDGEAGTAHENQALRKLLVKDPDAPKLRRDLNAALERVKREPTRPVERRPATGAARYTIRALSYHSSAGAVLIARLERCPPARARDADLRARYALTPAELNVTRLIARGRTNAEIADALSISPHTARRHTERILEKLGVRTRTEVVARLFF